MLRLLITYESAAATLRTSRCADWAEAQWSKIARNVMRRAEHPLDEPPARTALDMGQIAVACALAYVDFRHDARGWRQGQ